jgi:hypothetical protein
MNLIESSPASTARCGKVARLPIQIRDALNRRLENNEPAGAILPWLNSLPETKQVLAAQFQNAPITPQNLSEWRQGGFREWLLRRELTQHAESLDETAVQVKGRLQPQALADNLATVLAARYAALLNSWDGSVTPEFESQLRILRALSHDIVQLQKSLHRAAEQNLKLERDIAATREEESAKERTRKILPIKVAFDLANRTKVFGEERGRMRTAAEHNVTLEEIDLFCGPPSYRIAPNPTTSMKADAAGPSAPFAAAAHES